MEPIPCKDEVKPDDIDTETLRNAVQKTLDAVCKKNLCVDRSIILDLSKLIEDAVYNGVKRALNE